MQLPPQVIPQPVPELVIEPIKSMDFFKQCQGFKETCARYGSAERFFKFGQGYALSQREKIISEVYTDYIGGGHVEIGILTHPDYRSQGFGFHLASYLINKCREQNYIPGWSCQTNNKASMRLAIKLGFQVSRYYVQMVPTVGNTLGKPLINWIKENPDWTI